MTKAEALDDIEDEDVKAEPAEEDIEEEFDREEYHREGAKNFLDRLLDEYEVIYSVLKKKDFDRDFSPHEIIVLKIKSYIISLLT